MILTLDLGTSTTKAVVWAPDGPRAEARAPLITRFEAGDRAEQDPRTWWPALVSACAQAAAADPGSWAAVEAVGFAAARQTMVAVDGHLEPLRPALLWSDRRATAEAEAMAAGLGGPAAIHRRTGAVLDGAAPVAKAAWLAAHEPGIWAACRALLTPRDFLLQRLTGVVLTDPTMVSAAGLTDGAGSVVGPFGALLGDRLPEVRDPGTVAGALTGDAAAELGLRAGLPVVLGAGDRACEALGTGAGPDRPLVSWGTTANVSIPVVTFPDPPPAGLTVTRAAGPGWLLEGGLSAAGSLLHWLSGLTGVGPDDLMVAAAAAPIGSRGVLALPWFGGARAPWWRDRARGAFLGLSFDQDPGDLARAVLEAVAADVARCLAVPGALPGRGPATALALTGGPGPAAPWAGILSAVTGLPVVRRRSGQSASAGAALLTAATVGLDYDLDHLDPVAETTMAGGDQVSAYAALRPRAEAAARAVIALDMSGPQ